MLRWGRSAFLGIAVLLVGAVPAVAAPAWLPAKPLGNDLGPNDGVDVAVNTSGMAAAAWVGAAQFGDPHVLQVAVHRPGGGWVVSPTAIDGGPGFIPCDPHVGVDDAGGVTVVWRQIAVASESDLCSSTASTAVQAATLAPGADVLSAPQTISGSSGNQRSLSLAVAPNGQALAAWVESLGGDWRVEAALRPVGGSFAYGEVGTRFGVNQFGGVTAALDGSGNAVVGWDEEASGFNVWDVFASARADGAAGWPVVPDNLTTSTSGVSTADGFALAADRSTGELVVAYGDRKLGGTAGRCAGGLGNVDEAVCARRRSATGLWQPVEPVAALTAGRSLEGLSVSAAGGQAAAAWAESIGFDVLVHAASRPAVGAWVAAQVTPTSLGDHTSTVVAVAPGGGAIAAWADFNQGGTMATVRGAGSWASPVKVAPNVSQGTAIAVDGAGNTLVATQTLAQVAVWDASGPDLVPVVPATATAGVAVPLAVTVTDRWSPLVGLPQWTLSDGATASAASLSHAYAAAGTYTATITQADALGNASTATATTTVAPPPPPPPPPSLGLGKLSFTARWHESRLTGKLVVRGTAAAAATVTGTLERGTLKRAVRFTVPAGAYTVQLPMPSTLLPGTYTLRLAGQAGGAATAPALGTVKLAAPPEGVVDRVKTSTSRNGPDGATFTNARRLFVTFHFAAVPRAGKGRAVHLDIGGPGGIKATKSFRGRPVTAAATISIGARLPKGRWTFVLKSGSKVVQRVGVRLR